MAHSTERLAITLATRVFEPEGTAAAFRLGNLVRALEAQGHTVTVLTSRSPAARQSTHRVRRWPVLRDSSGSVRGYLPYMSFDAPVFFRLLFGPRADVIVVEPPPTTGFVARVACWFRRTPYVYYAADVLSSAVKGIGASRFVVSMVTWLERRALRGAVGVLTTSDESTRQVVTLGASSESVAMVGTGVDTKRFSPHGRIEKPGVPYFIYTGTMSEVHGAGVFIDAFSRVAETDPDVCLRVFGSGVEFDELQRQVEHLGDRVRFAKPVGAEELAPWIRGAVASLASVRPDRGYDFAYATKALTSLSCGTPVIYAGTGPVSALIRDNRLGWTVDWDPIAVADAMRHSLDENMPEPDSRLSAWVEENYSLNTVAASAAEAITVWASEGDPGAVQ